MAFDIRTATPAEVKAEAERRAALRSKGLPLAPVRPPDRVASAQVTAHVAPPVPSGSLTTVFVGVHDPYARMNKTERAYALHLERLKANGLIRRWYFEAIRFVLAPGTTYTPDFAVIGADGELYFVEVKGFWREDAKVKIKVAAGLFPFRFKAVQKKKSEFIEQDFTVAI